MPESLAGPWKTWTHKKLDPEKPELWKTFTVKNMNPEQYEINMELKVVSYFKELHFIKIMHNLIYCSKSLFTNGYLNFNSHQIQALLHAHAGLQSVLFTRKSHTSLGFPLFRWSLHFEGISLELLISLGNYYSKFELYRDFRGCGSSAT